MKLILLQKFLNSNGYLTSKFHSYDGDLASPVHSWWWSCFTTSTLLIVIRIQEFMSQDDHDLTQQFHFHDSDLAVWSYSTIPLSWWWYSDTGATTFGSNVNEMLHLWLCMWMEECYDRKKKEEEKKALNWLGSASNWRFSGIHSLRAHIPICWWQLVMNFVCKFDVRHDGHQPLLELWLEGPSNKKVTANIPWSSNQSNLLECSQNCLISHLLKTYFDHVRFSFAVLTIQRLKTNDTQHSAILNYRFQYMNCNTPTLLICRPVPDNLEPGLIQLR